jgi:hypothetical protein
MANIPWPMWTRPASTDEVMPIDVTGPDGPITVFTVAVTAVDAAQPTAGQFTAAVTDGNIRGPLVGVTRGLTPGTYWAWAKVNNRVLPPIPFVLF